MLPTDVERLARLLDAMRELELALERYYHACSIAFGTDAAFWETIAAQEHRHAEILERVKTLVARSAALYSWGRPFQPAAVKTMTTGVLAATERLQGGELTLRSALVLARDYERSVIEIHYGDVVKSDESACAALIREVVEQTAEHKASIERRMAMLPGQ